MAPETSVAGRMGDGARLTLRRVVFTRNIFLLVSCAATLDHGLCVASSEYF
jgi:hypothetical protein